MGRPGGCFQTLHRIPATESPLLGRCLTPLLLFHGAPQTAAGLHCWWACSRPNIKGSPHARRQGKVSVTGQQTQRAAPRSALEPPHRHLEKKNTVGKICSNSPAGALLPRSQQICARVLKEKLPGEIHNLFLTSAAQLTNDSPAFSSVTDPSPRFREWGRWKEGRGGGEEAYTYLYSCMRHLAEASYFLLLYL